MPTNLIYCDANVFLSYFNQIPDRIKTIDDLFDEVSRDDDMQIVTSTVSLVEVAYFESEGKSREIDDKKQAALDTFWANDKLVRFIEFHEIIARSARTNNAAWTSGSKTKAFAKRCDSSCICRFCQSDKMLYL